MFFGLSDRLRRAEEFVLAAFRNRHAIGADGDAARPIGRLHKVLLRCAPRAQRHQIAQLRHLLVNRNPRAFVLLGLFDHISEANAFDVQILLGALAGFAAQRCQRGLYDAPRFSSAGLRRLRQFRQYAKTN